MRDGFIAKISRNGTFSTGMKNRISAPVDDLNAGVVPMTCDVGVHGRNEAADRVERAQRRQRPPAN